MVHSRQDSSNSSSPSSSLARIDAIDYLATPAVAAYFEAREYEAYHGALKRANQRRDFHEALIPVLERFVVLTEVNAGAKSVDEAIAAARRPRGKGDQLEQSTVLDRVRAENPVGVELLELDDNPYTAGEALSFETLKTAYRRAARRYHPDVGGDHESMVAVNEAFSRLHELVSDAHVATTNDDGSNIEISSNRLPVEGCSDYRFVCGRLLFLVALDDWNVDAAVVWLDQITSDVWQRSRYAKDEVQWLELTEPAGTLATRLAVANRVVEAERAIAIARRGVDIARKRDLNFEWHLKRPEAVLAGAKRSPVVINHPRQAEYALRLGVIDQKKYQKALDKYAADADVRAGSEETLRRFQKERGFLRDLPSDRAATGKRVRSALVPDPDYYITRIEQLSNDQQAEYLASFGPNSHLSLVRKYTFVRLVSLLESVAFYPLDVDVRAAAEEATVVGILHDDTTYASAVSAVIGELASYSPADRIERAGLLRAIDASDGARDIGAGIRITVGNGSPLGVPLTAGYMKNLVRPVVELRVLQQNGRLPETDSERADRDAWSRDVMALRAPAVEALHKQAFAAIDTAKTNPEHAVEIWTHYLETLLALGVSMVHVEQLQPGYWVDRLTATLVRLKRNAEALAWLERYFRLPERYRGRSSHSEDERLRNRLNRCRGKTD